MAAGLGLSSASQAVGDEDVDVGGTATAREWRTKAGAACA